MENKYILSENRFQDEGRWNQGIVQTRHLSELKRELGHGEARAARVLRTKYPIGERCTEYSGSALFQFSAEHMQLEKRTEIKPLEISKRKCSLSVQCLIDFVRKTVPVSDFTVYHL